MTLTVIARVRLDPAASLRRIAAATLAPLLAVLLTAPLAAQIPVVQNSALDAEASARSEAQRQLTEALGFIAADGSNWFALSQAGRAALALGDARAAAGFLARAEALAPRDPVIKAALGATMVQLEDPAAAMRYFDSAVSVGGLDRAYLGDRGLAFDLLGNQARAQADYAVAQAWHPSAELTRRWAISLGISGRSEQAVQMLGPLLRAQDRAAWRSRAMIVAMNGRPEEARQIARTTMPAQLAEAIDPYFPLMDRLTPAQLAAASHFGRFPTYEVVRSQPSRSEATRVAAATTAAPAPATGRGRTRRTASNDAVRATPGEARRTGRRVNDARAMPAVAAPAPAPAATSAPAATRPAPPPASIAVPARVVAAQPGATTLPAASSASPAVTTASTNAAASTLPTTPVPTPAPAPARVAATTLPPSAVAGPPDTEPRFTSTPVTQPLAADAAAAAVTATTPAAAAPASAPTTVIPNWSMADLVASIEIPAAERAASANALTLADLEAVAAERRAAQRAAAQEARTRAAAEARTRAEAEAETRRRAEADAAARAEAERLRRNPARIWVQVATGANLSALAFDCRRLTRERSAVWAGQSCSSATWGRTRRLVVGPFRNQAAARAWESAYKRAGGDAFIWTSDAGEEVTPVGGR